jgi:hypothetical protein
MSIKNLYIYLLILLSPIISYSQNDVNDAAKSIISIFDNVSISGQWFIAYITENENDKSYDEFILKRGYLTFKKPLGSNFSMRITQDIAVDREGDGEGDVEIRLKYGYLKYKQKSLLFFNDAFVEFGVAHRPWLDFEQKINKYRVQGKMFLERYKILRSADYGVTIGALIGGKMDKEYQKKVNKNYPGKYGSLSFGVYNGGGYEAIENNKNKLFAGRFTLRPIPEIVPGLQISYGTNYGKGNTSESPDFISNTVMGSFECEGLVFTGTYYRGTGDVNGEAIDSNGVSLDQNGYSIFAEKQFLWKDFYLFARHDNFDSETNDDDWLYKRYIAGISYYFVKGSKILMDIDLLNKNGSNIEKSWIYEIALEFKF